MDYSVGFSDRRHQLRVAVTSQPLGPYVDTAQSTDPDDVPFAIDPHSFVDDDGHWYLFHAHDFLGTGDPARVAPETGAERAMRWAPRWSCSACR